MASHAKLTIPALVATLAALGTVAGATPVDSPPAVSAVEVPAALELGEKKKSEKDSDDSKKKASKDQKKSDKGHDGGKKRKKKEADSGCGAGSCG